MTRGIAASDELRVLGEGNGIQYSVIKERTGKGNEISV
jgi:hypothetical protein